MKKLKILFKVNASTEIGYGHFKRCLSLAEMLQEKGHDLFLQTNRGNPLLSSFPNTLFQALDLTDEDDVHQLLKIGREYKTSWIVLDGYNFDETYERRIKNEFKLFRIDDVPRHIYSCDVLLSQNYEAENWAFEATPNAIKALGLKYLLLPKNIRELPKKSFSQKINFPLRILVTLGGASVLYKDHINLLIKAFDKCERGTFLVTFIIPDDAFRQKIQSEVSDDFKAIGYTNNFGSLSLEYDFVITSPGTTMWELMYLGIPFGVLPLNENQRNYGKMLSEKGLCLFFDGDNDSILRSIQDPRTCNEILNASKDLIPRESLVANIVGLIS